MKKLLFILLLFISYNIFANSIQLTSSTPPVASGISSFASSVPSSVIPPSQLSLFSTIPSGISSVTLGTIIPAIITISFI